MLAQGGGEGRMSFDASIQPAQTSTFAALVKITYEDSLATVFCEVPSSSYGPLWLCP